MKSLNSVTCGVLLLTALLWPPSNAGAQGPGQFKSNVSIPLGCGCTPQDEKDLNSRLKSIEAMIAEYKTLMPQYRASKHTLNEAIRDTIQGSVKVKLRAARDPGARDFKANTSDLTCHTTYQDGVTACLKGALEDHEQVHRDACKSHKGTDWRFNQLAADYIQEEIDAYQKEYDRLQEEVNKLQAFCSLDPSTRQILIETAAQKERETQAVKDLEFFTAHTD